MKFMDITDRMKIVDQLRETKRVYVGRHRVSFKNGLVHIENEAFPRSPFDSRLMLDNPMTMDTFMNIYLLDKGGAIIT